jgi:adenosylhomocysteinase
VASKVAQGLRRLGSEMRGKLVVVNGCGAVGEATARAARELGARVLVIDSTQRVCDQVAALRDAQGKPLFEVVHAADRRARAAALARADVVIGATGRKALSLADYRVMRDGVIVASASSSDIELGKEELVAHASQRERLRRTNPLVHLPTVAYTLGRKRVTLLGDGWPVNFDGDVEDIPAAQIQITRALMFAGALQAAGINANDQGMRRIIAFDPRVDQRLLTRCRQIEKQTHALPIGDPGLWRDDVRRLARLL